MTVVMSCWCPLCSDACNNAWCEGYKRWTGDTRVTAALRLRRHALGSIDALLEYLLPVHGLPEGRRGIECLHLVRAF